MPIYEYCCRDCGQIFEEWQKDFADKEADCPVCAGTAERILSETSFVLKGSGWYTTDYCGKIPPKGNGRIKSEKGSNGSGSSESKNEAAAVQDPKTQSTGASTGR